MTVEVVVYQRRLKDGFGGGGELDVRDERIGHWRSVRRGGLVSGVFGDLIS